ncbi:Nucleotidyltransferase domain protein [Phycisphaerae bacterium RAS1]|nr:Nucleotidyltransferase domain protein [Phycisphaerae bacterium RAS1]
MIAELKTPEIADLCRRWRIRELALFGSALRGDSRPDSDIDLLVTFEPGADWSLLEHIQLQTELSAMLGRPVDMVTRRTIERSANPIRRNEILSSARTVYAA